MIFQPFQLLLYDVTLQDTCQDKTFFRYYDDIHFLNSFIQDFEDDLFSIDDHADEIFEHPNTC